MVTTPANKQQNEVDLKIRDQIGGAENFDLVVGEIRTAIITETTASMVHKLDDVDLVPDLESFEKELQGGFIFEIDPVEDASAGEEITVSDAQQLVASDEEAEKSQSDGTVPVDHAASSEGILGAILPGLEAQSQTPFPDLTDLLAGAELSVFEGQRDFEGQSEFGYSFVLAQGAQLEVAVNDSGYITEMFFAKPDGVGGGNDGGGGGGGGGGKKGGGGGGGDDTGDTSTGLVTEYTSGPNGGYNIELNFVGDWAADPALVDVQQDFIYAADLLSTIIIEDVPNIIAAGYGRIDDITIQITLESIDGPGNVLGGAGFIARSSDPGQPYYAEITLDLDDVLASIGTPQFDSWDDVAVHEMIHAIGFSYTTFDALGLVTESGGLSYFTGAEAYLANNENYVLLENDGGSGTALSHWEEDVFVHEIMTGYIDTSTPTYISDVTVAALSDIGYTTVDSATWTDFAVGDPIAMV